MKMHPEIKHKKEIVIMAVQPILLIRNLKFKFKHKFGIRKRKISIPKALLFTHTVPELVQMITDMALMITSDKLTNTKRIGKDFRNNIIDDFKNDNDIVK